METKVRITPPDKMDVCKIKPIREEISKDQVQVPTECTTCNLFMTQISSYIACTTLTTKELRK